MQRVSGLVKLLNVFLSANKCRWIIVLFFKKPVGYYWALSKIVLFIYLLNAESGRKSTKLF
jgi:hypothetical protein